MANLRTRAATSVDALVPVGLHPCSFGVDEITPPSAWMPQPKEVLDWTAEIGYEGTELGPVGYFGKGAAARVELERRRLKLVGAYFPQRLSYAEHAREDREWLTSAIESLRESTPEGSQPIAILGDGLEEAQRQRLSGRINEHPEAWLSDNRFRTLVDNLHRAAEICLELGLNPVFHPHAGTYIETAGEIDNLMSKLDVSLVGLCLDTGHFKFGGADPVASVEAYGPSIRHVHLKDCNMKTLEAVGQEGGGFAEAVARGVFTDLGQGDSEVLGVVAALQSQRYNGWLVVEQDRFLGRSDTRDSIVESQRRNREFLRSLGI